MYKTINRFFNSSSSHILLYHSTFRKVPNDLSGEIHNVTPDEIYKQLKWLKNNFDIVSVDELFSLSDFKGKASITFDDAYKSVFLEALPILKSLNLPCTVFLNGSTLEKKIFWRDKVRYIINTALVKNFVDTNKEFCQIHGIDTNNFYRRTKHPAVNSILIENLLDKYFYDTGIDLELEPHCVDDISILPNTDLVSYGNHSYSHYVMSSLTKSQQSKEILRNTTLLNKYKIKQSRVFSIPFGDDSSFNDTTISLLQEHGYFAFLYSRNRLGSLNKKKYSLSSSSSMYFGERYMPRSSFSAFQIQLTKLNFLNKLGI